MYTWFTRRKLLGSVFLFKQLKEMAPQTSKTKSTQFWKKLRSGTTYPQRINKVIELFEMDIPFATGAFTKVAIGRLSSSKRPSSLWTEANRELTGDRDWLYLISWTAKCLGLEVDHMTPVSKGGSYNVENLRLLPKSINRMIGDTGLTNDEINQIVGEMSDSSKKLLGIPVGFRAMGAMEFFRELAELKLKKLEQG